MTYHYDVEQRSPAWHALRLGRLCGSRAGDMMTTRKDGKPAASRENLKLQLVLERVTGHRVERDYVSAAMQQGIDREFEAAALYQAIEGVLLMPVGFVSHDELRAGCSPDGLVAEADGLVEIKAPEPVAHWAFVRTGVIPADYYWQIIHNLFITELRWCDFVSFNPDFPEALRLRIHRIARGPAEVEYAQRARTFLAEVDLELDALAMMADPVGVLARVEEARA